MHLLAIVGRVSVIYVTCMVLLRVTGRREMSDLGPMDLLTMLLLSETVSPAITGGDNAMVTGIVAAVALMALCVLTEQVTFRSRRARRIIEGEAVQVIRDGKVDPRVMRRFLISDADLKTTLHQHGLMSVGDVRRAYVEADGEITIVKVPDAK